MRTLHESRERPCGAASPLVQSGLPMKSTFELIPQKLIYGGCALGHHEGRPLLVRGALAGERVEVETVRQAKGMVHARLLRVITPSPERVPAPCPYFGTCGGCHYQHLDSARQIAIKREILRETLRRIGGIDWRDEIKVRAADPWRYRNHAQLKIGTDQAGGIALGFFEADSHRLVPIEACLILSPRLNQILAAISRADWRARLTGFEEIDVFADDRGEEAMLTFRGRLEHRARLAQDCLSLLPGVKTVAFEDGHSASPRPSGAEGDADRPQISGPPSVWGKPRIAYRVGDYNYEVSPGSFFQASRFLLPELVDAVAGDTHGTLALDLYAGVGLFALPLARRFERVIAVEANPPAAADLNRNARAAGLMNASAVKSKASDFLRRYAQGRPDLVVLDPPRAGAEPETLRLIARLAPDRIYYVSCQPPTLARDLALLRRHGYRLDSVELFDLFPQTFHIESIAKLTRF